MFDLAALDRAESALAQTTGKAASAPAPQRAPVCLVTGKGDQPQASKCPVAHGEHHG